MPRVRVNGWRFLYRQAGSGRDVVLLPGATDALAGRLLFDSLSKEFRVTVYLPRRQEANTVSSADMADNLRGLKTKLGLGPSHLVAHGDAAVAALHTAVLYPDMVAGLVLTEPRLPEGRNGSAPNSRSALTTRRILLIDQPVFALCSPCSSAQTLCRFLEDHLPRCRAESMPDDPERLVAQIQALLREMAGVFHKADAVGPVSAPHMGMSGPRSRSWPQAGEGFAMARWITRLSAWNI